MSEIKTILVIGTYDTKSDELAYLSGKIEEQGGKVLTMDISVLKAPPKATDISRQQVAEAADSNIETAIKCGDENIAMQIMARGAASLCASLYQEGRIDAMIAMGGTMGTDVALDCALVLPLGVPKYIISTISFSPIIPADRLPADVQMILWAGGLYGLNSICKSSLSQAAGAVLGAAKAVEIPVFDKPIVGMTSLGSSCLSYMKQLKPALERRGFDVAVFHSTGMGGQAFENLAKNNTFSCVMDFCMQEFTNGVHGSIVNSGANRLKSAGQTGIPQIIAPGASDLIDLPAWAEMPEQWKNRTYHAHNRLIGSVAVTAEERCDTAREMVKALADAKGPVHVILPNKGIEEWDREGAPLNDPKGLTVFCSEMRKLIKPPIVLHEIDAHINDQEFVKKALEIFDSLLNTGFINNQAQSSRSE